MPPTTKTITGKSIHARTILDFELWFLGWLTWFEIIDQPNLSGCANFQKCSNYFSLKYKFSMLFQLLLFCGCTYRYGYIENGGGGVAPCDDPMYFLRCCGCDSGGPYSLNPDHKKAVLKIFWNSFKLNLNDWLNVLVSDMCDWTLVFILLVTWCK